MKQRRQRARERDWAPWNRLNGISLDPLNSFLDFLTSFIFFSFPGPGPGSVSHGVERIVVISFSVRFARLLKRKVPKNCVIFFRKRQTNTIESFPNLSFTMTFMNGAKTKIKIFRIVLVRLPWMDKIMSGKWKKNQMIAASHRKGLGMSDQDVLLVFHRLGTEGKPRYLWKDSRKKLNKPESSDIMAFLHVINLIKVRKEVLIFSKLCLPFSLALLASSEFRLLDGSRTAFRGRVGDGFLCNGVFGEEGLKFGRNLY